MKSGVVKRGAMTFGLPNGMRPSGIDVSPVPPRDTLTKPDLISKASNEPANAGARNVLLS